MVWVLSVTLNAIGVIGWDVWWFGSYIEGVSNVDFRELFEVSILVNQQWNKAGKVVIIYELCASIAQLDRAVDF